MANKNNSKKSSFDKRDDDEMEELDTLKEKDFNPDVLDGALEEEKVGLDDEESLEDEDDFEDDYYDDKEELEKEETLDPEEEDTDPFWKL